MTATAHVAAAASSSGSTEAASSRSPRVTAERWELDASQRAGQDPSHVGVEDDVPADRRRTIATAAAV